MWETTEGDMAILALAGTRHTDTCLLIGFEVPYIADEAGAFPVPECPAEALSTRAVLWRG
jgi:hypothetical protein